MSDFPCKKMHGTAWKLVNDFVQEAIPVWDVTLPKSAQGHIYFSP